MREQDRSPNLPTGLFNWVKPFWKIPDEYALQHQSLDAYLFLRFLRMTVVIMFVGCCITWPVLFPINITGGGGQKQLDLLSMSNVNHDTAAGRYKYFAHALIGWIFFGFVLLLVTRESIFYINLRQAFLLSPAASSRLSSRTVLFTSVPKAYLDESKLRRVFGSSVRNVWITADTTTVDELVDERDKVAYQLESAEVKLIKEANGERLKAIKKGATNEVEPVGEGEVESGSIASRWIPQKKRPTHKLGKFGLYGKKVDSINWSRSRLEELIPETAAAQEAYRAGETALVGAVFIEFNHQSEAQAAFQTLSHHQALHMSPRYIGVKPNEIIWKSLQISWWQKVVRRFAVLAFISAMIIFWAIPVAFVGLISNVTYLEGYVWLHWLKKIPTVIMGVVTGLLPSVMLSILMSLVPVVMRLCARISGEPTRARVELFTQNAYFAFQLIQVFLVATVASSASGIIEQLTTGKSVDVLQLLSTKIPTASNLYISYFMVQGLTISSGVLSQVVGFFVFKILYKFLAGTPRKMYVKWSNLSAISWGSTLPVFTNIAVIGIVYACIAPLVLGFATVGMSFFYLAYRYNILFVTDSQIDTQGLIYPRALQQLICGLYVAEVCLLAMFAVNKAWGPLVLTIAFLIFTILYHFALNSALDPLLYNLPKSLEAEEESIRNELEAGTLAATNEKTNASTEKNGTNEKSSSDLAPVGHPKPNFLTKFLKPHIYSDYATLRQLIPHDPSLDLENLYSETVEVNAYYPPAVTAEVPLLWIPRDEGGISAQEIRHTSKIIPITDDGSIIDDKNKVIWNPDGDVRPPLFNPKILY